MSRIKQRRGRHFMDEQGRLFWINGPDQDCYLSEQRLWRPGLSFDQILEWKQCAPSGKVSQRFASLQAVCEAFDHHQITWFQDLYLRRMGDQMALHRSAEDYKPTAFLQEEARGLRPRHQPWRVPEPPAEALGPCCGLPPRQPEEALRSGCSSKELAHGWRRRRSARQLAE